MKNCTLIFSGSGTRLIAFCGALKALEEEGVTVAQAVGTSGGAVVASLLMAGYTASELQELVNALKWSKFEDKQVAIWNGLCKGDYAYKTIRQLLDAKHVRTFETLNGRLKIVASDVTNGQVKLFGDDPTMEVALAVRMSMSIPLFYRPLFYKNALMDDGGLFCNLGVNLVPDNPLVPTLALRIFDAEDALPHPVYNGWNPLKRFIELQKARIDALLKSQAQRHVHDEDWSERTIQIDGLGISGVNFKLTEAEKQSLYASGYQSAQTFLTNHPDFFNSAHRTDSATPGPSYQSL